MLDLPPLESRYEKEVNPFFTSGWTQATPRHFETSNSPLIWNPEAGEGCTPGTNSWTFNLEVFPYQRPPLTRNGLYLYTPYSIVMLERKAYSNSCKNLKLEASHPHTHRTSLSLPRRVSILKLSRGVHNWLLLEMEIITRVVTRDTYYHFFSHAVSSQRSILLLLLQVTPLPPPPECRVFLSCRWLHRHAIMHESSRTLWSIELCSRP